MKIHAVLLFALLSVSPLGAMDPMDWKKRSRDCEVERTVPFVLQEARVAFDNEFASDEKENGNSNIDSDGSDNEQDQNELTVWEFVIPVQHAHAGRISAPMLGIAHKIIVGHQFSDLFSYAKTVKGTAFVDDQGDIDILSIEGISSFTDYHNEGISIEERPENVVLILGERVTRKNIEQTNFALSKKD